MSNWPVEFIIKDTNRRARLVGFRLHRERHYVWIHGIGASFELRIPASEVDKFCLELRKFCAGELGKLALEAEYNHQRQE